MDRRAFLFTIAATLVPKIIKATTPKEFLTGIHYLDNDGVIGTWNGITRSTVPQFSSVYGGAAGSGKSSGQLVAMEMERIIPKLRAMFERDNHFYSLMEKGTQVK